MAGGEPIRPEPPHRSNAIALPVAAIMLHKRAVGCLSGSQFFHDPGPADADGDRPRRCCQPQRSRRPRRTHQAGMISADGPGIARGKSEQCHGAPTTQSSSRKSGSDAASTLPFRRITRSACGRASNSFIERARNSTRSAGAPTAMRPRSAKPQAVAGVAVTEAGQPPNGWSSCAMRTLPDTLPSCRSRHRHRMDRGSCRMRTNRHAGGAELVHHGDAAPARRAAGGRRPCRYMLHIGRLMTKAGLGAACDGGHRRRPAPEPTKSRRGRPGSARGSRGASRCGPPRRACGMRVAGFVQMQVHAEAAFFRQGEEPVKQGLEFGRRGRPPSPVVVMPRMPPEFATSSASATPSSPANRSRGVIEPPEGRCGPPRHHACGGTPPSGLCVRPVAVEMRADRGGAVRRAQRRPNSKRGSISASE